MNHYIGVKLVKARPMALGDFCTMRGVVPPEGDDPSAPGYLIVYPDGYESWSPKEIFEAAYLDLGEQGTKITKEVVTGFTADLSGCDLPNGRTTLVEATDRTGYAYIETSTCVDPANYDRNIGIGMCMTKIRERLWANLGFVLRWACFGLSKPMLESAPILSDEEGDEEDWTCGVCGKSHPPSVTGVMDSEVGKSCWAHYQSDGGE